MVRAHAGPPNHLANEMSLVSWGPCAARAPRNISGRIERFHYLANEVNLVSWGTWVRLRSAKVTAWGFPVVEKPVNMMFPKQVKAITVLFSLLQFFYYFNFFWLIQNVYFLQNGITYTQLSILLGVWSLVIIILEIPSGIVADKFGRKPVIVIGKLAFLLGIISFVVMKSFPGFIIGMIFWGIHQSFISGAQEALIFDELKSKKQEVLYKNVLSIATISREIGLGTGVLIAGVVTHMNISYNLIGSIVIASLGFGCSLLLPNAKVTEKSAETKFIELVASSKSVISTNLSLKRIILFSLSVIVSYQVISEYFVVTLRNFNLDYRVIGILAFFEMVFFSFGTFISSKITKNKYDKTYIILSFVMAALITVITTRSLILVIAAWMGLRIMKAISEIISNSDWQSRIESSARATTTSFKSFAENIVYIPLAVLFGFIADKTSLFTAFYLIAITAFVYILISFLQKLYRDWST